LSVSKLSVVGRSASDSRFGNPVLAQPLLMISTAVSDAVVNINLPCDFIRL
jgi:hypothetical protein